MCKGYRTGSVNGRKEESGQKEDRGEWGKLRQPKLKQDQIRTRTISTRAPHRLRLSGSILNWNRKRLPTTYYLTGVLTIGVLVRSSWYVESRIKSKSSMIPYPNLMPMHG